MNSNKGAISKAKGASVSVSKRKIRSSPRTRDEPLHHTLSDVIPEEAVATVVYNKVATTSFTIKLSEVKARGEKDRDCYDLAWQVPGFGLEAKPKDGLACHVSHSVYTLENLCDFILYIRLQRPLGYKQDANALAMWEPITNRETLVVPLHPRKMLKFNVSHAGTNLLCPRHLLHAELDYLHLVSIAVFRESTNIHGNDTVNLGTDHGLALQFSCDTHYRVNDGTIGKKDLYLVRTYHNTAHMDVINAGPVYPVRMMDAVDAELQHVTVQQDNASNFVLVAVDTGGLDVYEFNNLDTATIYRLPSPIFVSSVGFDSSVGTGYPEAAYDVVKYYPKHAGDKGRWLIGANLTTDRKTIAFNTKGKASSAYSPVWAPSEYFRPIAFGKKKSKVTYGTRNVKGLNGCVTLPHAEYQKFSGALEYVERVLSAIVEVASVVHSVAQFAAALGLLAIRDQALTDDTEELDQFSCLSGQQ